MDETHQASWLEKIQSNVWRDAIELFLVYRYFNHTVEPGLLTTELTVLFAECGKFEDILYRREEGYLVDYFGNKDRQGWCCLMAFLRMLILLCRFSASNPKHVREAMEDLKITFLESTKPMPPQWQASISSLSAARIHSIDTRSSNVHPSLAAPILIKL